jgi:hypothetical protein
MFFKCIKMVLGMLLAHVFDSEVIYDKRKGDWSGAVFPKAWYVCSLGVAMNCESFSEELIGKNSGLGQAVHPLPNFNVNVVSMY